MKSFLTCNRKVYAGECRLIFSPDCNGKPTAKRSEARTWNGKQDCIFCGFACSASNYYVLKRVFIIIVVVGCCFFSADVNAQKNTARLIEEIKILMPYRTTDFKIDQQYMPIKLSIKAANYKGLKNYADYLKQSLSDGSFENFSENCLNHIASRKIKNPNDSTIFDDKPATKPIILD